MADGKDRGFKLGDISPLAGLVTGERLTSRLMGGIPALLDYNAKGKDEDKKAAVDASMKTPGMKRGGAVKKYAKGGSVSSASKRADGCAQRGKTRGKMR